MHDSHKRGGGGGTQQSFDQLGFWVTHHLPLPYVRSVNFDLAGRGRGGSLHCSQPIHCLELVLSVYTEGLECLRCRLGGIRGFSWSVTLKHQLPKVFVGRLCPEVQPLPFFKIYDF